MYWYRDQWKALPPKKKLKKLRRPVHKLVLSYKTHFPVCYSASHCDETMKSMQKYYMDVKGLDDIPYSFVIGGDEEIYEGRGFKCMPDKRLSFSRFYKDKLHIAFIGDWTTEEPPREMKVLCTQFVGYAIDEGVLDRNYELLVVRGKYKGDVWERHAEELQRLYDAQYELYQATKFTDFGTLD